MFLFLHLLLSYYTFRYKTLKWKIHASISSFPQTLQDAAHIGWHISSKTGSLRMIINIDLSYWPNEKHLEKEGRINELQSIEDGWVLVWRLSSKMTRPKRLQSLGSISRSSFLYLSPFRLHLSTLLHHNAHAWKKNMYFSVYMQRWHICHSWGYWFGGIAVIYWAITLETWHTHPEHLW